MAPPIPSPLTIITILLRPLVCLLPRRRRNPVPVADSLTNPDAKPWWSVFSWRNPVAVFGGISLIPLVSILGEAHRRPHHPAFAQMPAPVHVHALRAERRVIEMKTEEKIMVKLTLRPAPFEPFTIHLSAWVDGHSGDNAPLRVGVSPSRSLWGPDMPKEVDLQVEARSVVGTFEVYVKASDQRCKDALAVVTVHVRTPVNP